MNLKNKKIILRVDFNVPIAKGKISDDFRLRSTIPSIKYYLAKGARVLLVSHLEVEGQEPHLDIVADYLRRKLETKIRFIKGKIPASPENFTEDILLFDNIRLNPGEKKNDLKFARTLSAWGDYYVNEAFSASHREHASIVSLPKFLPHEAGPLFKREVAELSKFFKPKHPFLFVLAGKKFETKEPLVRKFLEKADALFIGGALGNTFLKLRGFSVGNSKVESIKIPGSLLMNGKILLPQDAIVERRGKKKTVLLDEIEKNDLVYDTGPVTSRALGDLVKNSKFILWNGTLGLCEDGYSFGTREFANAAGKSKAFRLAGGGDTVAAIRNMKLEKNFDFISTGGGAMLEFLAQGTLPGIEALKKL